LKNSKENFRKKPPRENFQKKNFKEKFQEKISRFIEENIPELRISELRILELIDFKKL